MGKLYGHSLKKNIIKNLTAKEINKILYKHHKYYDYKLLNSFVYDWESDFFGITKAGYTVEVEIKISKNDFKADFNKTISGGKNKHKQILNELYLTKPNKFYFCCPRGLIHLDDIDDNYGLIWIQNNDDVEIVREAKFLHKNKILENKKYLKTLLDKFYYRNLILLKKLNLEDYEIRDEQNEA